ncbi:N-acetyltransferase [Alkalicaulis satelles]|uniref:N-acetyltransferase n=1 Tax=Alkalicaulis satelles TaxID=2609175 RepID=A0A5M6ZMT3_9PROT|nr:GNAT family N-acetyltransferase [Alkalicaulis satelles]KAA5804997.1 N-acetyltransferase [Alkalicaulis satelles]
MTALRFSLIDAMASVPPDAWDGLCAAHAPGPEAPEGGEAAAQSGGGQAGADPFLTWGFLQALEAAGCVGPGTGWTPRHLIAEDEEGRLAGAMPLYLKDHSYGEYVFDHAWAHALESAGGRYYPKLIGAVPFTPVTGPRLLTHCPETKTGLMRAACSAAAQLGVSSLHVLFPHEADRAALDGEGFLARQDIQFIFTSEGYRDYADFLDALSSRKRKALKKERETAQAGVSIELLTGSDITEAHWDVFYACYLDTGARKWGSPYLNRTFFSLIGERMADRLLLVMARTGDRYIASALNFIGEEALYGRYWGALEGRDSLHFELCYHQAIDYALAHGLTRVEAGAQGAHKLARGYRPRLVHSAHHIEHEGLRAAVARFLRAERPAVAAEAEALDREGPFKASV